MAQNAIRQLMQAASNSAASNVSGPVDMLSMILRKMGIPVPTDAVGGSEWMAQRRLTAPVESPVLRVTGETAGLVAPIAMAAKAPQIANSLRDLARDFQQYNQALGPVGASQATVWHGSPHKFDKFDSSKIGTGEGAQAYGHGLYLAESPDVAKTYKDLNPTALSAPIRAFRGAELTPGTPEYHAATLLDNMGLQQARKTVLGWIVGADPRMARESEGWRKTLETLNAATSKADFKQLKNQGNMYRVDLPDDKIARMLDWDAPLSQQAPEVQNAAAMFGPKAGELTGQELYKKAAGFDSMVNVAMKTGGDMARLKTIFPQASDAKIAQAIATAKTAGSNDRIAAQMLRDAGIPGIRYLDGGSRGAGQGTRNYVVFPGEENILKILARNGEPVKGVR